MYEVRKTTMDRYAVRKYGASGTFVYGTGIVEDSHTSNISIFTNEENAWDECIRLNELECGIFGKYFYKNEDEILLEIDNQLEVLELVRQNIKDLKNVWDCKKRKTKQ